MTRASDMNNSCIYSFGAPLRKLKSIAHLRPSIAIYV